VAMAQVRTVLRPPMTVTSGAPRRVPSGTTASPGMS
jgi:hypothetical protein